MSVMCREYPTLDEKDLRIWCALYREYGTSVFLESREFDISLQNKIVEDKLQSGYSIREICVKYRITSRGRLRNWIKSYKSGRMNGQKSKKTSPASTHTPQSDAARIKELERELLYVKAENALLKKVKALVEEQESRARLNGQKPSTN